MTLRICDGSIRGRSSGFETADVPCLRRWCLRDLDAVQSINKLEALGIDSTQETPMVATYHGRYFMFGMAV